MRYTVRADMDLFPGKCRATHFPSFLINAKQIPCHNPHNMITNKKERKIDLTNSLLLPSYLQHVHTPNLSTIHVWSGWKKRFLVVILPSPQWLPRWFTNVFHVWWVVLPLGQMIHALGAVCACGMSRANETSHPSLCQMQLCSQGRNVFFLGIQRCNPVCSIWLHIQ
jgi:hypothetical protein